MQSLLRFLLFVMIVSMLVLGGYAWRRASLRVSAAGSEREAQPAPSAEGGPAGIRSRLPMLSALDSEFTSLIERVTPSVVSIEAKRSGALDAGALLMRQLFGLEQLNPASQLGSGVIVSDEGHIITNLHVIAGTDAIDVYLSDGRKLSAAFLGADPLVDLAVLKIDAASARPLRLANSDNVRVGQLVFAIGNPLGLQETVSQGIVSGKARRASNQLLTEFFQTDAAINPGNSGGPLVDLNGEIIGINNAVAIQSQGISFAIPSNLAARVLDDVVKRGRLSRPWFGASIQPLTPQIAEQLGIKVPYGILVTGVGKGTPAERSGVRPGDVLVQFNGKPLRDRVDVLNRLAEAKVDDLVTLRALRAGRDIEFEVRLEDVPMR